MAWVLCFEFLALLYFCIWIVLFIFPDLLHCHKRNGIDVTCIAHRGGAGEELENTLTAFKRATEKDMQMLELDCYLTRDHHVVVSHDPHLLSLTGQDVYIQDLNYEDLPSLSPELAVEFSPGHTCCGNPYDRKIPLLREVFEQFPDVSINLNVGTDDEILISKVVAMVREFKREGNTVLGDVSENVNQRIHEQAPDLLLFFSEGSFYRLLLAFYLGIIPFIGFKESFFEIPPGSVLKHAGMENWLFTTFPRFYDAVVLNPLLIYHLHRRGIKVFLWVLNSEDQWKRAFQCGADAVMTDYPSKLRDFAKKNGLLPQISKQ